MFRRAGVALSMTEGFHPKPRINFPSALAVGIAGLDELLEVDLAEPHTAESLRSAIAPQLPPGMNARRDRSACRRRIAKRRSRIVTFRAVRFPPDRQHGVGRSHRLAVGTNSHIRIERDGREAPLDLRPLIADLSLDGDILRMRLRVDREGSARPARSARGT